jgi:mycothiol synthase
MHAGPSVRLRAPALEDAPAVRALRARCNEVDLGEPDIVEQDVIDEWTHPGFDLARDAAIAVEGDGALAGLAIVGIAHATVAVAPEFIGRGIGTRLRVWVEARERALGRSHHRQGVAASNGRARGLLVAAGYAHVRSYHRMSVPTAAGASGGPVGTAPAVARLPAGFSERVPDRAADEEAMYKLDDAAFSGNPDYRQHSLAEFRADHLAGHDLDLSLSRIAETVAGEAVGYVLVRRWVSEGTGFVDILGVHPDHRRRGLGRALLRGAFGRIGAAGLRRADLAVASDNPRAMALYASVGMAPRFTIDAYERPVAQ